MLTPEEEKFLEYWSQQRNRVRSGFKQFRLGLTVGLAMGIAILLNFATGWYSRATMVANSQSTPLVIVIAVVAIALFLSFFFKQYSRETNEQRYRELLAKKEKLQAGQAMQQPTAQNGQDSNS